MELKGLILGLRGLILGLRGLILDLRGLIWGLRGAFRGGQTDRRTDRQTKVRNGSPLCSTGHRPFGAAAQKGDRPTDRPINQPTDLHSGL